MVANDRSISVINTVIKIITKILASMLQEHLPKRELFILIVDTLNRFLQNHQSIVPPNSYLSPKTIQFADDTVIISEANLVALHIITRVLKIYGELTSLKINKNKSLFVPVAITPQLTQVIQIILDSPETKMSIKYLGLPLSIKKPHIVYFQPMIQIVRQRMEGWKLNFLSCGGRIILVKAVTSAIPIHFM